MDNMERGAEPGQHGAAQWAARGGTRRQLSGRHAAAVFFIYFCFLK